MKKKDLVATCNRLNIAVPETATIKTLKALIDEYFREAAIITTDEGLAFRQTSKPTSEYYVTFTLYVVHRVRAESEEAACNWLKENVIYYYRPRVGEMVDIVVDEIIDVEKDDELEPSDKSA